MRPVEWAPGLALGGGEAAFSGGGRVGRALGRIERKPKEARQKVAEASICDGQQEWV